LLLKTEETNMVLINKIPHHPSQIAQSCQIETLVDKILKAKKQNPQGDTTQLERQIDHIVYELYGLTEE